MFLGLTSLLEELKTVAKNDPNLAPVTALRRIEGMAGQAIAEVERARQQATKEPQEVRDAFAAVAFLGLLANPQNDNTFSEYAKQAWLAAEIMMYCRTKDITKRATKKEGQ